MNKNWWLVILAACFEVMWVTGLKYADNPLSWVLTILSILISFGLLIHSGKQLPTSTVYAVFVGLGTAGTVITEMIWFHVSFSWMKVLIILLLLIGIVGLKLVSHEQEAKEGKIV